MNIHVENYLLTFQEGEEEIGRVLFPLIGEGVVEIKEVRVHPEYRGLGYASELMEKTVHYLREHDFRAEVTCSYGINWFKKHPGEQDVLIYKITPNPDAYDYQVASNRVYLEDGGRLLAEVDFPLVEDGVVDFNHTFVDSSLKGQGIAHQLYIRAMDVVKQNGWKARPSCSFAVTWFERNKEEYGTLFQPENTSS